MEDSDDVLRQQLHEMYEEQGIFPNGIYITSGKSLELCEYIRKHNLSEKTVLVTFDNYPELDEYLRQGIVTATVYQNLYKQAKNAFEKLVEHIIGHKSIDNFISPVPELILKSNLDFYTRKN